MPAVHVALLYCSAQEAIRPHRGVETAVRIFVTSYRVALAAFRRFNGDDGWAIASHIALSTLMALFPFLIVLASLARLFGLGEIALIVGSLIYSYAAVQGHFTDDRWANLGWTAGAELSMLAAATIILGIDRPLQLPARHRVPGHPIGSRAALLVTLVAIVLTLGVAAYALLSDRRNVALVAVGASVAIAIAMAMRARDTLRTADRSSEMLDDVLVESERTQDELHLANSRLRNANAELRTLQLAVAQGFNLIDERTQGRLRELVQEAGDDLAALVDETID